jgi:ribosomal protein S27AE
MSKGDTPRRVDYKVYAANYDAIDWSGTRRPKRDCFCMGCGVAMDEHDDAVYCCFCDTVEVLKNVSNHSS